MKAIAALLIIFIALVLGPAANSQVNNPRWSYNDYGGVGLLQTRNARFADDGQLALGYSEFGPHWNFYLTFQTLPWLEGTFRYARFKNRAGADNLYDRSFDTKIGLWKEDRLFPSLAVGLQDFLGTGEFAGEYVVASKRFYDFDFSLGLGWGRIGSKADFGNPLSIYSKKFDTRGAAGGIGGRLRFGDFFRGQDTAVFGGVEYITPIQGLRLKIEFNGDEFVQEQITNTSFDNRTRLNYGIEYTPFPWIRLAAAHEQGRYFLLRATLNMNAKKPRPLTKRPPGLPSLPRNLADKRSRPSNGKDVSDPKESRFADDADVRTNEPKPRPSGQVANFFDRIESAGVEIDEIQHSGSKLKVKLTSSTSPRQLASVRELVKRITQILPLPIESVEVEISHPAEIIGELVHGAHVVSASRRPITIFFDRIETAKADIDEIEHTGSMLKIKLAPSTSPRQLANVRRLANEATRVLPLPIQSVEVSINKTYAQNGKLALDPSEMSPMAFPTLAAEASMEPQQHPRVSALLRPQDLQPIHETAMGKTSLQAVQRHVADLLRKDLSDQGLTLFAFKLREREAIVYFENTRFRNPAIAVGRAALITANTVPKSVEIITLVNWSGGMETARISLLRKDLESVFTYKGSLPEVWANVRSDRSAGGVVGEATFPKGTYPKFDWSIDPAIRQGLFDPVAPYVYRLWAKADGKLRLARGLDLSTVLALSIYDNFEKVNRQSDSVLPHVRSDVLSYIKEGRKGIARLQANYMWNATPGLYARVSAGYLEEMFGGVSGEVLYRPRNKRWAVGAELHRVRQRNFNQLFGFRDYEVTTGHLDLHYDTPLFGFRANLAVGRYLAGDWGGTFGLTRVFDSGIGVGGFFTFTDVPFDEFGEGSFDKGIFLTIPLDIFFSRHTKSYGSYVLRPLTRDGGQRVVSAPRLYDVTNDASVAKIRRFWRNSKD